MPRAQHWPVLWNPSAGFWRRHRLTPADVAALARQRGLTLTFHETANLAAAQTFLKEFIAKGERRLLVAGGDGTVRFAIGALAGRRCTIGILPQGSANNVARSLGIPFGMDAALATLATGEPRPISLGKANSAYFVEAAGVGFSADVLLRYYATAGRRKEPWTFLRLLWRFIRRWQAHHILLSIDGTTINRRITACIIANAPYFATAIPVAPGMSLERPTLEVLVINELNFAERLGYLLAFAWGRHPQLAKVETYFTRHLRLDASRALYVHADDQIIGTTPVELTLMPEMISVVVPQPGPKRYHKKKE